MPSYEANQHLHGGQGQFAGPQVPHLGHGNEIENQNWVCRDNISIAHEMINYEVSQHLHGGQGQVSEPQVPPLGQR